VGDVATGLLVPPVFCRKDSIIMSLSEMCDCVKVTGVIQEETFFTLSPVVVNFAATGIVMMANDKGVTV